MRNKLKIINDPVHGFIKIPYEILFDVIEHPYFQRLRRISQTGLLSLVFPGATHTRFHHALGAMHLMFTALETLKLKGVKISADEERAAMLAILLHDIGHGPYSHALESVLMQDCHHENISLWLMDELNKEFMGELSLAIEMFRGEYSRKFFNQLISSQLDVDRLDYLKRDSFYTGVAEGNVNTQRITSMINVCDDELVVDAKGVYSVENFLTARMFMYWQVYFHKTSAIGEHLLIRLMKRAKQLAVSGAEVPATPTLGYFLQKAPDEKMTAEDLLKFTELDDSDVFLAMKSWLNHPDFLLSYFSNCLVRRNFPKTVISGTPFSEEEIATVKQSVVKHFGTKDAAFAAGEISRTLLPYNRNQPIKLMNNRGECFFLEASENRILAHALTDATTKHILWYPRELLHT